MKHNTRSIHSKSCTPVKQLPSYDKLSDNVHLAPRDVHSIEFDAVWMVNLQHTRVRSDQPVHRQQVQLAWLLVELGCRMTAGEACQNATARC